MIRSLFRFSVLVASSLALSPAAAAPRTRFLPTVQSVVQSVSGPASQDSAVGLQTTNLQAMLMAHQLDASRLTLRLGSACAAQQTACPTILEHTIPKQQHDAQQSLCQFSGKVVLVVNTTSFCGYTRQHEALEVVNEKRCERRLAVIGLPSNEFGLQEPGSNQQIAEFRRTSDSIRFPLFGKAIVIVRHANGLFDELAQRTGARPKWRFPKCLIDRKGAVVKGFGSSAEPDSGPFLAEVERLQPADMRWFAHKHRTLLAAHQDNIGETQCALP